MEPQFDLQPDRAERKTVPAERSAELPDALHMASQMGNQAVQRVATTRSLQRSPAAAGLVRGGALARQEDEEHATASAAEPTATEAAPEAAGAEAADAAATESAPAEGATEAPDSATPAETTELEEEAA